MIVATVIGNILVCLSVVLVRKLRHPSNYLLVSLAISDLCVAILVMPLALHYELTGTWNLSPAICDLWVSFDVTCCTSSILNLCMISIDRYLAITKPLTYGVRRTAKRILSFIGAVWVASVLISIPPLLVSGNEHGTDESATCEVSQNIGYQLYATLSAFYIPLSVMIVMYYKIYIAAKRVVEAEQRDQRPSTTTTPNTAALKAQLPLLKCQQNDNHMNKLDITSSNTNNVWTRIKGCDCYENTQKTETIAINTDQSSKGLKILKQQTNGMSSTGSAVSTTALASQTSSSLRPNIECQQKRWSDSSTINASSVYKRRASNALRERKASFTLGVIMTAFTVCWLPFFILALLKPFSASVVQIPRFVLSTTLWLGYANSMLNPIIYVTFHQDFRRAFKYLLCLQCATMGSRLRAEAYQSQYGTERGHYVANEFAASNADSFTDNKNMIHYKDERRSTGGLCSSSVDIIAKDRMQNEATL
ncbi:5-hydroxytryptamine receptor 1-like [Oppia nitens]|uniref:5-hydroxytryptamine receptor 1-like n=1 Tax=Oppia nitens TaxID=1686743 RepID=UPI0023DA449D|nr:5-hydroxytryptamine receptor 1-like [Oppia nitens]